jgi:23S rRNA (cytosine1962-C5)-methyltransferase
VNEKKSSLPVVILKPGREKAVLRRHPWIFSGAIQKTLGNPECGDLVEIKTDQNKLIAMGAYSHKSQIRCRIISFNRNKNTNFLAERIQNASHLRNNLRIQNSTSAYRLIHAESDRIPGLVVDIYNRVAIMQLLSCGVEVLRDQIAEILLGFPDVKSVYEQSEAEVRALEGLPPKSGFVAGETVDQPIEIVENNIKYSVSTESGQKTGFYLDQRNNRLLIREFSADKDVLDCFCYTGGFSLNAYEGGAKSIIAIDSSEEALDCFAKNIEINNFDRTKFDLQAKDVFKQLRLFRDQGRSFDLIVLDPPKFAPTRKQINQASRGYKDINLLAIKLLRPGGILFTFSCSGGIDAGLFQKIVAGAALDAEADVQIIQKMSQAEDHPILLSFPEGEYLKGLVCIKQ